MSQIYTVTRIISACVFMTIIPNDGSCIGAPRGCHLKLVGGQLNRFRIELWGKVIIRTCPHGKEFDITKCQCVSVTKKLQANEIVNGWKVNVSEVPWVVAVGFSCPVNDNGKLSTKRLPGECSGVLVGPRWVLTARHCEHVSNNLACPNISKLPDSDTRRATFFVEAGATKYGIKQGVVSEVLKVYYHQTDIDIALLHLETTIQNSNNIKTIPVAKPGSDFYGRRCTIAGYGYQKNMKIKDGYVRKAQTTLLSPSPMCPKGYFDNLECKNWMLCTRDHQKNSDTCRGDSGGPVVCANDQKVDTVVGIAHAADESCSGGYYAIYANVAMFYDRMMEIIQQVDGSG